MNNYAGFIQIIGAWFNDHLAVIGEPEDREALLATLEDRGRRVTNDYYTNPAMPVIATSAAHLGHLTSLISVPSERVPRTVLVVFPVKCDEVLLTCSVVDLWRRGRLSCVLWGPYMLAEGRKESICHYQGPPQWLEKYRIAPEVNIGKIIGGQFRPREPQV